MKKNEKMVPYSELPGDVAKAVDKILSHRKDFKIGTSIGLAATTPVITAQYIYLGLSKAVWGSIGGVATGAIFIKTHGPQFNKEYLDLYDALKQSRGQSLIRNLFVKFPYVAVDGKGNLIGKKRAPQLWKIPLGRKRVINPNAGRTEVKKWKRNLPKKSLLWKSIKGKFR